MNVQTCTSNNDGSFRVMDMYMIGFNAGLEAEAGDVKAAFSSEQGMLITDGTDFNDFARGFANGFAFAEAA